MFKSGFVTIVGRPNVGKSTLLNNIIGEKISIISDKPQTTRNKIQLIYNDDESQIIFIDTPGIQLPKNELGEYMLNLSKGTLEDVDVITFMVDSSLQIGKLDNYILNLLESIETPIILLINKTDTVDEDTIEQIVAKFEAMDKFEKIIPISALENNNVDAYLESLKSLMGEGPRYYPEDMITDQPERNIIAEIVREKALLNLAEEIPHGIFVDIEEIKERTEKELVDIRAVIYVEKKSHKGMVIGKAGQMIGRIGSQARHDIERLLATKINLQLWVKIEKDWRNKKELVKRFGYF